MVCKLCGEEADELMSVKVNGRSRKACEECIELLQEEGAMAEAAESAMQGMMEYKGR